MRNLFLTPAPVIDPADLGRGARLLIPNGLAFGALQMKRRGQFHDWLRDEPDRHHLPGSRHAVHLGVDLAFFVIRKQVHMLPVGLPVRAPASGVVACTFKDGTPELEPGGLILRHHAEPGEVCAVTYLGDVHETKLPGDRVRAGDVVGSTLGQRHAGRECVVVHLGVGLEIPGHGLEFFDPTVLLKHWRARHPVFPGSTCTPSRLHGARPGTWQKPGRIAGSVPGAMWDPAWRTRY